MKLLGSAPSTKLFGALAIAAALALATGALAGDALHTRHHVEVMSADDAETFDVSDMEIGESRSFYTEDGKEVYITREEDGLLIDADGEEIRVEMKGDPSEIRVLVAGDEHMGDLVDVMAVDGAHTITLGGGGHGGMHGMHVGHGDSVFISGLGEIDEYQKEQIIQALEDAGIDKKVVFGGGDGAFQWITTTEEGEGDDGEREVTIELKQLGHGEAHAHVEADVQVMTTGDDGEAQVIVIRKSGEVDEEDEEGNEY